MNAKPGSRFSIAPDVVFCELHDKMVLLDTRQGSYFSLNPVAAECWELMGEPRTLAEISDKIAGSFEVPEEVCRPDVARLLDELVAAGLVETCDG